MCIAAAPALLALSAIGTGVSMYQQVQAGRAQSSMYKAQAKAAETSAALRADQRKLKAEQVMGAQRARAGVSGAQVSSFSEAFGDTLTKTAQESYLDKMQTALNVGSYNFSAQQATSDGYAGALRTGLSFATQYANTMSGSAKSVGGP